MASISWSRRTVALVVAVIFAAIATIALISYVQGVRDEALGEGEAVQVFRASGAIAAGTSVEAASARGLIEVVAVPRKVVPDGAIGSLDQIAGRVAAVTILPGEELVVSRFVAPGQVRQGGVNIPSNRIAMSMEVGVVPGVAGFIQVGDRINVLAQLTVPVGAENEPRVKFILQDLEVLQVGRRIITPEGQEATQQSPDQVILTLAVTPAQAERLGFAIFQGQLYLTLLPEGYDPVGTPGRVARNAFPG